MIQESLLKLRLVFFFFWPGYHYSGKKKTRDKMLISVETESNQFPCSRHSISRAFILETSSYVIFFSRDFYQYPIDLCYLFLPSFRVS